MSRIIGRKEERSKQSCRDDIENEKRYNLHKDEIPEMEKKLRGIVGKTYNAGVLLAIAIATSYRSICIDRRAKRLHKILLCWFCENWKCIEAEFKKEVEEYKKYANIKDYKAAVNQRKRERSKMQLPTLVSPPQTSIPQLEQPIAFAHAPQTSVHQSEQSIAFPDPSDQLSNYVDQQNEYDSCCANDTQIQQNEYDSCCANDTQMFEESDYFSNFTYDFL